LLGKRVKKGGTQIPPPCLELAAFPWGMIVLSQEQTELSPRIPSFQKKERIERILKNIGTISKRTKCILNQECALNHIEIIKI